MKLTENLLERRLQVSGMLLILGLLTEMVCLFLHAFVVSGVHQRRRSAAASRDLAVRAFRADYSACAAVDDTTELAAGLSKKHNAAPSTVIAPK